MTDAEPGTKQAQRHEVLLSTRLQFAPEVQPVKSYAIDRIVEQNILLGDAGKGLTMSEIKDIGGFSDRDSFHFIKRL